MPADGQEVQVVERAVCTSVGGHDEFRSLSSEALEAYWFHTAPKSYYSGFINDFRGGDSEPNAAELPRIRDALSKLDRRKLPPVEALFPLEKVALTEVCYGARRVSRAKQIQLYLGGAWLSDDAGEDKLAEAYRKKALPLIRALAAEGKEDDCDTWVARYRQAALTESLGQTRDPAVPTLD